MKTIARIRRNILLAVLTAFGVCCAADEEWIFDDSRHAAARVSSATAGTSIALDSRTAECFGSAVTSLDARTMSTGISSDSRLSTLPAGISIIVR